MTPASITQASIASTTLPRPGSDDAAKQDGEFGAVLADLEQGGEPTVPGDIATPTLATPTTSLGLPLTTNAIAAARSSASPPRTGGADVRALLAKLSNGSDMGGTTATTGLAAAKGVPPTLEHAATAKAAGEAADGSPANVSTTTDAAGTDVGTTAALVAIPIVAMPLVVAASATPAATDATAAPAPSRARPAAAIALAASKGTGAAATADVASPSARFIGDTRVSSPEAPSIEPDPLASTPSGASPPASAGAAVDGSVMTAVKISVLGTTRHLAPASQTALVTTTDGKASAQASPPALLGSSSAVASGASAADAATTAAVATTMVVANASGARPASAARGEEPLVATGATDPGATPAAKAQTPDSGAEPARSLSNAPDADAAPVATMGVTAAGGDDGPAAQIPRPLPLASGRDPATRAPASAGAGADVGEGAAFADAPSSPGTGIARAAGADRSTIPDTASAAVAESTRTASTDDTAPVALPTGTLQAIAGAVATLADEAASVPAAPTAAPQVAPTPAAVAPARSLTLQLSPGGLGAVTVHLHLGAGGLDVRLSVENDETRGAITRARDELAAAIGDTGSRLDSLTIRSADPSPALAGSHDPARHDTPPGNGGFPDDPGRRGSGGEGSRRRDGGTPPREPAAARDRGSDGDGVFV